ncbi:MAG: signal peptidase I [bacterium]
MDVNVRDVVSSVVFYAGVVVVTLLLIRVGTTYGWEKVDEQSREMAPRLKPGQYTWINKRQRRPQQLAYDDIIVYKRPLWKQGPSDHEFGRVVGKPGDLVEVREGEFYRAERRGGKLGPKERITQHYVQSRRQPKEFSEFIVPHNTVFVLYDVRSTNVPLRDLIVPLRSIRGKVIY